MKVQAIIPAAGLGERLGAPVVKALVPLQGQPLLIHTLRIFDQCSLIDSSLVVAPKQHLSLFEQEIREHKIQKVKAIIPGGKRRCDSVLCALNEIDEDTGWVVIHDGARPFVTERLLTQCIQIAFESQAAIAAVPVKSTIKKVDIKKCHVLKTLDRQILWEAQTPQVFKKELLVKAYKFLDHQAPTDDASLVEQLGVDVKIVEGQYQNIKITTPEDLMIAKIFLESYKEK